MREAARWGVVVVKVVKGSVRARGSAHLVSLLSLLI